MNFRIFQGKGFPFLVIHEIYIDSLRQLMFVSAASWIIQKCQIGWWFQSFSCHHTFGILWRIGKMNTFEYSWVSSAARVQDIKPANSTGSASPGDRWGNMKTFCIFQMHRQGDSEVLCGWATEIARPAANIMLTSWYPVGNHNLILTNHGKMLMGVPCLCGKCCTQCSLL